jgi:hypothetical protein
VVAAAALAAYWALWTLAAQQAFGTPRWLHGFVYDNAGFVLGVVAAIVVGAYVGRWWVLVLAATPIGVWAGLEAVGHVAAYHEATPPFTNFLESRTAGGPRSGSTSCRWRSA